MKDGKTGARRRFGTAAAATLICFLSALCNGASSNLNGLVLTGGTLTLDFADPANNLYTTTLDRLDVLTWSGGSGALAGQNLVFVGPITSVDTCTEPVSSFGQTSLLYPGQLAAFANRTATTMTSITTGGNCDYFVTPNLAYSQTTVYTTFPAGDPNANEFRVVRTFPTFNVNDDGNFPPTYDFNPQYMGYVPAVSSALFGTVLYPNTAGSVTTAADCDTDNGSPYTGGKDGGCVASDWAGTWFADDNGSGSGIVIFRDASSTAPAVLNVFFPPMVNINFEGANANQNLTMIAVRPAANAQGQVPSVTETEWVCVYDPTTWSAAARAAGTLPTGCAQHAPTATVSPQFAFTPAVNVTPGTVITSNVVHLSTLGTSTISITGGGSYSLNGAAYSTANQVFSGNGDLTVQVTSGDVEDNETELALAGAVVTINGVSSEFLVVSSFGPSITVQVAPTTVVLGQTAELTWNTYGVNTCSASGAWNGAQTETGSTTVTPTAEGTYTYTLQCTENPPNDDKVHATVRAAGRKRIGNHTSDTYPTLTGSATLTVTAGTATPTPTVTLAANPTAVTLGTASTLTWSSTNATACTASGAWTGAQATSGTSAQTPTAAGASTYTLTCSGTGGSASASATVTATAAPAPAVTIAVSPTSIIDGGSAHLTWSSNNATACTASGSWSGSEAVSGSNAESPTSTGSDVYTLTCTGAGGTATASATLTVSAPTTVVSTTSGRIGGGGAIDLASLLGLLSLTWLVRGARAQPGAVRCASLRFLPGLAVAIVAAVIVSPFPARAADEFGFDFLHSYVGVRAGESIYQPSVNSILTSVGPDAADISSLSIDKHQFGGVVYAGVPIWRSLSLEIGYAQIGQFPLSMTTVTSTGPGLDARAKALAHAQVRAITGPISVDSIAQQVVNAAPPAGHGVTLGFALPIDITSRISVEPRISALVYKSDQTLRTPDATVRDDSRGSGFDVGGTVTARVFHSLYVGAGVDCFHQTRACNVVVLEGVIEYRFGR